MPMPIDTGESMHILSTGKNQPVQEECSNFFMLNSA